MIVCLFETKFYVFQASYKITMYLSVALNSDPPVSTSQVLKLEESITTPAL